MRKLFNEFFYIPKHGKIREKVMLTRVVMTITIMVMCLAAMSITAYAYFSYNITSGSNIIKAAHFDANVSITIMDSNNDPITVTKDGKVQTANLDAGKYTIELTKGNSTADTGFCVISIGDNTYYTDQIGVDVKKDLTDATVKFDLWLSSPTKLEVLSHWGTSVYYGYGDDGRTEIFIVSEKVLDLTTQATSNDGKSEDNADKSEENTTTPSTNTTTGTETPSTQTSESTTTPSTGTSTPVETTPPETTGESEATNTTEPSSTTTEPAATEPASTESTTETQSVTENSETTGAPTTEANE